MSKKDFGCFFCPGKSTDFDGVCNQCRRPINIEQSLLALQIEEYTPKGRLGRGFNGWMLHVEASYQSFAMKIVPSHRLKAGALAESEVKALAACGGHRNLARFFRHFKRTATIDGSAVEVLCLVFEYIPKAQSLNRFIDSNVALERRDIAGILIGIASGLARMHANDLWHDDLHDDNILLRTVGIDENLNERFEAKVIDFGSTKPISPDTETRSDYHYLAKHIFNLVLSFESVNANSLTPVDRAFSARLRRLGHRLADTNNSRRNLGPTEVANEIRNALDESTTGQHFPSFQEMKDQSRVSLTEPLANTNALTLAPQDIALLFRDSLGWTERIKRSEPVFVVGPRGCGKTMLLRFLSIASNARPQTTETTPEVVAERLAKMRYVGFLVNVGQLRTPFLRSGYKYLEEKSPALAEDFCREYLNTQFTFEVIRSVLWLATENLIRVTSDDKNAIVAAVNELLPARQHAVDLDSLAEVLDRRIMDISSLQEPEKFEATGLARDDVLVRLARGLRNTSCYRHREIWFLLDDYSVTVLPALAQQAYNPVLFRLATEVRVKVSSEGDGPDLTDSLGRKYKEGRELAKVNLGEVYFRCNEEEGKEFFEQILEARFSETKVGTLKTLHRLLGEHERLNDFGKYICSLARPGDARFYGFALLCRLCSGDVSFVIELLHSLTQGRWDKSEKLTPHEQDVIVKKFAHRQLGDLRSTSGCGPHIHAFATNLGEIIKTYLLRSAKKKRADERLRIEIKGEGELSAESQANLDNLLRHSVLISGGAGKSKLGSPTRKLFFRRIFSPCFPFSPTRGGCIDISITEFESWLRDPSLILTFPDREKPKPAGKQKRRKKQTNDNRQVKLL